MDITCNRDFRRVSVRIQGANMVSKQKFVRDIMAMQEARKCAEKEAQAIAMINLENVYWGYVNNKKCNRGKKYTKPQYQC